MLNLLRMNKRSLEVAMAIIIASTLIIPLLPLQKVTNQGFSTALTLLIMIGIYAFLASQWIQSGAHKVRVKKIMSPVNFIVIRGKENMPINLYGVVPPHVKQADAYQASLEFIQDLLSTGTVQIKSLPDRFKTKTDRIKYTRVIVDGIDIAEECLRQGKLWLDPNIVVPRAYRMAEDQGKTWNRGHFKKQQQGELLSPFKFAIQELHKKEDAAIQSNYTPASVKVQQWGGL